MEIKIAHVSGPESFRLNVAYMDRDRETNTKPAVLWWRPPWTSESAYEASGCFDRVE
ncbi:MAG: hypothetical protein U5R06_03335 [candidate division KSB1 bacterium]|nr:hypothetical protein [candidate division KSB1 bacterium]